MSELQWNGRRLYAERMRSGSSEWVLREPRAVFGRSARRGRYFALTSQSVTHGEEVRQSDRQLAADVEA